MKNSLFPAVFLAGLIALVGCQTPTTNTPDAIIGTWTMATITQAGTTKTAAAAGMSQTLIVAANNTWSVTLAMPAANMTGTGSGTWSKNGGTYTLATTSSSSTTNGVTTDTTASATPATTTISGSTMTLTSSTATITFTKS